MVWLTVMPMSDYLDAQIYTWNQRNVCYSFALFRPMHGINFVALQMWVCLINSQKMVLNKT